MHDHDKHDDQSEYPHRSHKRQQSARPRAGIPSPDQGLAGPFNAKVKDRGERYRRYPVQRIDLAAPHPVENAGCLLAIEQKQSVDKIQAKTDLTQKDERTRFQQIRDIAAADREHEDSEGEKEGPESAGGEYYRSGLRQSGSHCHAVIVARAFDQR